MPNLSDAEQADRLGQRRARMLPMLALLFLLQQFSFFSHPPVDRAVDHLRIGAWVVLTAVLLLGLGTGGGWFRSRAVRDLLNDERVRANRAIGMQWGFFAAMLAAIVIYVLQGVVQFTTRETIHLIVSAGMVVAMVRFGARERRDHA